MKAAGVAALALGLACARLLGAQAAPGSDVDGRVQRAAKLYEQGRNNEAREIYDALLRELRSGPPAAPLGLTLNGLSMIAAADGDYNGAARFAREAVTVFRQTGDASKEALALNNEGIAEIQLGLYSQAEQTLESAIQGSRRSLDAQTEVQALNNLGSALYFPGRYSEALERYNEAMGVVDRNRNAKWSDYWRQITSFNQATLFQRLGRYEKALLTYRDVEKSSRSLTPSDRAHLYANLGALYRRLGDPYKALDTYRAAQKLYAEQHDAAGELTVLKNIGIVYALDQEDLSRAQAIFRSAIDLAAKTRNRREEMQAHLYLGETLFLENDLGPARAEFDRCRTLAGELGTLEEQWKSLYGLGRAEERSNDATAAESHYREAIAIIEKTRSQLQLSALRSEFFADKREAYDALIALLFQRNNVPEAFAFLERSRARNFQDRLQASPGDTRFLAIDEVTRSLPEDTALVEFWTAENHVGLVWCTAQQAGLELRNLPQDQFARIRSFLEAMPHVLSGNWREQVNVFDGLLPTRSFPAGIRHLLVVPDGWISYVPFDLLHAREGPQSLLIEKYDITFLPTAALLRRNHPPGKRLYFPWAHELSAFGDPVIVGDRPLPDSGENNQQQPQRLPYSAEEIRSIVELTNGRRAVFLQEGDLKKSFLSPELNAGFLLHVSTHAFADGDNPENSRMLFSPAAADAGPDYVFLRELYDMKLGHVRLATISACDTERGKIIRGEGVQAFSRALLSAGAASSLTTLWRVDDEPTAAFMKQFYYLALDEHLPAAVALQRTKLRFLQSNSRLEDPSLWAAFVLNGDGATPLPRVVSWTELIAASVGLVVAACAAAWFFLRRRSRVDRQHRARAVVS